MSELLRKVNDPLWLKLKLEPKDDTYFVRAKLSTPGGAPLGTIDLPNEGDGIYADDGSNPMPNYEEVRANYFVYYDASYTEEACEHGGLDVYKRDLFDPANLVPPTTVIKGTIKSTQKVVAKVEGPNKIKATIKQGNIKAKVDSEDTVKAEVKTNNKVKGKVYE